MFAVDIVIFGESRWRRRLSYALGKTGMKVSWKMTAYVRINDRHPRGTPRSRGLGIRKVEDFKFLG